MARQLTVGSGSSCRDLRAATRGPLRCSEQSEAAGLGAGSGPHRRAQQDGWQTGGAAGWGLAAFKKRARTPAGRPPCSVTSRRTHWPRAQRDVSPAASSTASTTNLPGPLRHPPPARLCPPLLQGIAVSDVLGLPRELQPGVRAAAGDAAEAGIGCLRQDGGKGKSMALGGAAGVGDGGEHTVYRRSSTSGFTRRGWEPLCPPGETLSQEFQELSWLLTGLELTRGEGQ